MTFGDRSIDEITTDDIEAFRDWRKNKKLSAVAINQDLRLLRKMFNWAVRKGYRTHTPFKIGSEPAIGLERERGGDEGNRQASLQEPSALTPGR